MDLRPASTEDITEFRAALTAFKVQMTHAGDLVSKAEIALAIYESNQGSERGTDALKRALGYLVALAEMEW